MKYEQEKQDNDALALNNTQKAILDATCAMYLDDIDSLSAPQAPQALHAITASALSLEEHQQLKNYRVWDSVNFIRKILQHPCPQNRSQGSPYVGQEPGYAVWEPEGHGCGIAKEPLGLLGLTARNDETASSVTKEAVVGYITQLINRRLQQYAESMPMQEALPTVETQRISIITLCRTLANKKSNSKKLDSRNLDSRKLDNKKYTTIPIKPGPSHFSRLYMVTSTHDRNRIRSALFVPPSRTAHSTNAFLNCWQQVALNKLYTEGLTEQMLLTRIDGGHAFNHSHSNALIHLVKSRHYSVKDALAEIEELSSSQADKIAEGLTRQELLETAQSSPFV